MQRPAFIMFSRSAATCQEGPAFRGEAHPEGLNNATELQAMGTSSAISASVSLRFPMRIRSGMTLILTRVLVAKAQAGASFAITQLFFTADDYFALVARVRSLGCHIPIIPASCRSPMRQVTRFAELSGAALPRSVTDRINEVADDDDQVRRVGIMIGPSWRRSCWAAATPTAFLPRTGPALPERFTPTCIKCGVERDEPLGWPGESDIEGSYAARRFGHYVIRSDNQHPVVFKAFASTGVTTATRSAPAIRACSSLAASSSLVDGGQMTPTVPPTSASSVRTMLITAVSIVGCSGAGRPAPRARLMTG